MNEAETRAAHIDPALERRVGVVVGVSHLKNLQIHYNFLTEI